MTRLPSQAPETEPQAHASAPETQPSRYPYVVITVPDGDDPELVSLELWELGATGVEQRDPHEAESDPDAQEPVSTGGEPGLRLVASFDGEEIAHNAARELGTRYDARVTHVVGDEWRDAWRRHLHPQRVGARLVLCPSWETVRTWPGDVVLTMDPGRAFGSGLHESTRLVLREIDRRVQGGERVLDVGCGSGILTLAALRCGAAQARAVDTDPEAVAVTRENARLNGVASRVRASTTPVGRLRGRHDLVLANIEPGPLVSHAAELLSCLRPGGVLVLSGIPRARRHEVMHAFGTHASLRLLLVPCEGDWVALVWQRTREPM